MKILSIIETAFRATLEEQDDAALWVNGALQNTGLKVDLLLRGNAVGYAVRDQNPSGVRVGDVTITRPRILDEDLLAMKRKGSVVHLVREDLEERGISLNKIVTDFEIVGRAQLPDIVRHYDHIWHW